MRVLFALPGLHRVNRGAEVAFESVANEIAALPGMEVALVGAGPEMPGRHYRFQQIRCLRRELFERWPKIPVLRNEYAYEEMTFAAGLLRAYDADSYDLTVTCGYPFTNWVLRARRSSRGRPPHVFVTQNGDWPAQRRDMEYRFFGCEGLVAINPEYHERNRHRWFSALIPNGVDPDLYRPGSGDRSEFGLPSDAPVVLMVSALDKTKRVEDGIRCAAQVPGLHMVVMGDGPLRDSVDRTAAELMPGRFRRMTLPRTRMPEIYRCADLVLHMTRAESFGNVYVEALAMGLPIVAHDNPNTRWILEDHGLVVDSSDHKVVTDGIRTALELRSPKHREQRRDVVTRRFTWETIARSYRDFFEAVLRRFPRTA